MKRIPVLLSFLILALSINAQETAKPAKEILDSAYKLICYNNPDRLEVQNKINKKLRATRKEIGEQVREMAQGCPAVAPTLAAAVPVAWNGVLR